MAETVNLGLPLLAPSQAQKHVTVNEALTRLDALAKGVLSSRRVATPPEGAADGAVWAVPPGATDEWAGREGHLAVAAGGGWSFVAPREGWRAWALDEGAALRHDGADWTVEGGGAAVTTASGAGTSIEVVEEEHAVASGVVSDTSPIIPRRSIVLGVTARVIEEITGTVTQWKLGNAGAGDRFGSGLGTQAGSHVEGLLGTPTTFWTQTPLRLVAQDGAFAGGRVRFAVHYMKLTMPAG